MMKPHEVRIDTPGADEGKTFILHPMPAAEAELWCVCAMDLLSKTGAITPAENQGAQGLAASMGVTIPTTMSALRALQNPELDGIWKYVRFKPENTGAPEQPLRDDHIEDWRTRLRLRFEFLRYHTGFFSPENRSTSGSHSRTSSS